MEKVFEKGYIKIADLQMVELSMYMFDVVKGYYMCMVYDGSKSGLNNTLWAPWFALPTIDTITRWTLAGTWLANNDYGVMFLNFLMYKDLQKYLLWGCWLCCAMEVKLFPYICTQGGLRENQIVTGNQRDPKNTFQWDHIEDNLSCSKTYNATRPEVRKVWKDRDTASDII